MPRFTSRNTRMLSLAERLERRLCLAQLSGTLWNDVDRDGVHEPQQGEYRLVDWTVFTDSNGNGVFDAGESSDQTDSDGGYELSVPAGQYTLRAQPFPEWEQTFPDPGRTTFGIDNRNGAVVSVLGSGERFDVYRAAVEEHGNWLPMPDFLPANLDQIDVLIARQPDRVAGYSATEIAAIQQFVADGGHLIFHAESGAQANTYVSNVNELLAPYHVVVQDSQNSPTGFVLSQFVEHPITAGVSQLGLDFYRHFSISQPTDDLTLGSGLQDALAILEGENGAGTVIVLGDVTLFSNNDRADYDQSDLDNRALLDNMLQYVSTPVVDHYVVEIGVDESLTGLDFGFTPAVGAPLRVHAVETNVELTDPADLPRGPQPAAWNSQRSDLRNIRLQFTTSVNASASDIVLTNLGIDAAVDPDVNHTLAPQHVEIVNNQLTISFAPYELAAGVYELELLPTLGSSDGGALDGNGDGVGGDSFVVTGDAANGLFLLPGNFVDDGAVSIFDFTTLGYWFGHAVGVAPQYADLNNDGGISVFDMPVFATNFASTLIFPSEPMSRLHGESLSVPQQIGLDEMALAEVLRDSSVPLRVDAVRRFRDPFLAD